MTWAADAILDSFESEMAPILDAYCYDCHGFGENEGGVTLDEFETGHAIMEDRELFVRMLSNLRMGFMPPHEEEYQPSDEERAKIASWIKKQIFEIDPAHPDPGRVTVRRLNRVEYRNTILDLMGVDFDTSIEFPPDDTGHGFDNIGDVLTLSPMLIEKYLDAAQRIVSEAVPRIPWAATEIKIDGKRFLDGSSDKDKAKANGDAAEFSYYETARANVSHMIDRNGAYEVVFDLRALESYVDNQFDYNECRLTLFIDGESVHTQDLAREAGKRFEYVFEREWKAGEHILSIEIEPLEPAREEIRSLRVRMEGVTLRGPLDSDSWTRPRGYATFFPDGGVPDDASERRDYGRALLKRFATRAFRRPVDADTVKRLMDLAEAIAAQPGHHYEGGIAQAMVAVLASSRFLFREEQPAALEAGEVYPHIDEHSLASRLSYFLWSSMPDEELTRLADEGRLRGQLGLQIERLMRHPKSKNLIRNFAGQWLQIRDIESVQISSTAIYLREHPDETSSRAFSQYRDLRSIPERQRTPEQNEAYAKAREVVIAIYRKPKPDLGRSLRRAMREESERVVQRIFEEDRSLLELIDSDYTYLNEELAKHYGIEGVEGPEMRLVDLPSGSPRGGVLTQGTVLTVTSNPTRTSPVKRGVFILENILGAPTAPPPPNIPALEDSGTEEALRGMSLRETLELHRQKSECRSCHKRMDPLGLALENFNAMGIWRDEEHGQAIDATGQLITGETFSDIRELKRILATEHSQDFYYCLSEKLLTYALGRGIEYYDIETLDRLVATLESDGGRPSALIEGIIRSAPFQKMRFSETYPRLESSNSAPRSQTLATRH